MSGPTTSSAQRLRRLRPTDLGQLAWLAVLLVRVEVLLKFRTMPHVAEAFSVNFLREDSGPDHDTDPNVRYSPAEWRWVLNHKRLTKRWPWDKSCLRRSLLLGWILRARDPDLMIGARSHSDGRIEAHAWIRLDGIDLDIEARDYLTF